MCGSSNSNTARHANANPIWFSFIKRFRRLYIFGGQRDKEYSTDFLTFDVDTHTVSSITADNSKPDRHNVPQSGFTQRATIDCERDEIYVLSVSVDLAGFRWHSRPGPSTQL